jgi:hypothetical protein
MGAKVLSLIFLVYCHLFANHPISHCFVTGISALNLNNAFALAGKRGSKRQIHRVTKYTKRTYGYLRIKKHSQGDTPEPTKGGEGRNASGGNEMTMGVSSPVF